MTPAPPPAPLTAGQIMSAIAAAFAGEPDSKILSVGHYVEEGGRLLPRFYSRVAVRLGDVRRCADG